MKIHMSNVNFSSASGPNTFMTRLAHQLSMEGHVIADEIDYDVALVCIEPSTKLLPNKPIIQRLDGIWFKNQHEFDTKNVRIKQLYNVADAVVWQSEFDKEMTLRWWGEPGKGELSNPCFGAVIRNGINLKKVEVTHETILEFRSRYKKIFVCSANWHRQKRLNACIDMFKHIRATIEPYSCLVVMGAHPDCVVADRNVYYTDALPHELCLEMYAEADWMIHLAWADHCPNVVCEALSQGCPVICSETGGTKELVVDNGVVLKDSHPYNYELYDYENPPGIDVTQLTFLPEVEVNASFLDIKIVAKRYVELFDSLLSK